MVVLPALGRPVSQIVAPWSVTSMDRSCDRSCCVVFVFVASHASSVQPALGLGPARPAAGPRALAFEHLPGARRATDGGITVHQQLVGQYTVFGDVRLHIGLAPAGDGRDLDLAAFGIPADDRRA